MATLPPYQATEISTTRATATHRPVYTTRRPQATTPRPTYYQIVRPPSTTNAPRTIASYRQEWRDYNRERYQTQYRGGHSQQRIELPDCPINGDECKLPDCFCSRTGEDIPGGLEVEEIPQMVLISYDGAVTDRIINMLKALFDGRNKKNNCPIRATLFSTHVYNNYDQTQWLMNNGFEVALSSMTGTNMSTQHQRRWYEELNGIRAALEKFSYANRTAISGVRAPMFTVSGDEQMKTIQHLGLRYDSSIVVRNGPFWPQTLNYRPPWECSRHQRCPQQPHQGLWEFPVNEFIYNEKNYSSLTDLVSDNPTSNQLYNALIENYNRHVESSRIPFHLPLNREFLTSIPEGGTVNALQRFLQTILQVNYTYAVSIQQAMEWIKRPTRLEKLAHFPPWKCQNRQMQSIQPCENPSVCTFMNNAQQEKGPTPHSFRVCGSCPNRYPWLNDPTGVGINLYN